MISAVIAVIFLYACQGENDVVYARAFTTGKLIYESHCANCHGTDGEGLALLIPPLTDTAFLKKNKSRLACSIRHGIADTLVIHGKNFDTVMPANGELSDGDLAAVVTFITNSFGNKQGLYPDNVLVKDLSSCK